jgi:lycopene beta-cyclase
MHTKNNFDLVIIGGGCTGLSLANELSLLGNHSPQVLVLEQREAYVNDRTWCFWDIGDTKHRSACQTSWRTFQIKNKKTVNEYDCSSHPYLMLASNDFYKNTLDNIKANENIHLLMANEIYQDPIKIDHHWHIKTSTSSFTSSLVVDTRPRKNLKHTDSVLWQSFLGYEIKTNADVFDPEKMVLMDFDERFKNGLAFIYLLPTSKNQALIEYTIFSENFIPHQQIVPLIDEAMMRYTKGLPYELIRSEHGILPMGNKTRPQQLDSTYLFSGLFAGAARASSGYAFQRIQSWVKVCAESISNQAKLTPFPRDPWLMSFMDGLFLNVLKKNPDISASIFDTLFKKGDLNTVIKFMSDQAGTKDYLNIMKSLPAAPFLKSLPLYLIQKLLTK